MNPKKPPIATLSEVTITRNGETAVIEYKEKNICSTHLTLGPKIHHMSDQDILDCHNDCIDFQFELMRNYRHIATEISAGEPQIKYFEPGGYWAPCGDVLRGVIDSDKDGETTIWIDDKEFYIQEFGKLLSIFEGWGIRIMRVPKDETYQTPLIEIKDPDNEKAGSIALLAEFISRKAH